MNRRGFTLLEFIAMLVIYAILSIISVPIIKDVISDSHKHALMNSVHGILSVIELDYQQNDFISANYILVDGILSRDDKELYYKGSIDANGFINVVGHLNYDIQICNKNYCAVKNDNYKELAIVDSNKLDSLHGNIIELLGTNAPDNNNWVDKTNSNNYFLTNVNYSDNYKSYSFNGNNSCVMTGRTLLPKTSDFTMEAYFKTASDTTSDQAIISQKITTSTNEDGRFKLNIYNGALVIFIKVGSNSTYFNIVDKVEANTKYYITIKRENNKLYIYNNGDKLSENKFNYSISSGTLQIGCWNSSQAQNYNGMIYLVNLYDYALKDSDIRGQYNFYLSKFLYTKNESTALAKAITDLTESEGLYISYYDSSKLVFKGLNPSNHIVYNGEEYRILALEDNLVKLAKVSKLYSGIPFDREQYRSYPKNLYCVSASSTNSLGNYYGCNAYAAADNYNGFIKANVVDNSSIRDYLNNTLYNDLLVKDKIIDAKFYFGAISDGSKINNIIKEERAFYITDKVGMLSVTDVIESMPSDVSNIALTSIRDKNTFLIMTKDDKNYVWTMNAHKNKNTYDVLVIDDANGSFGDRRASRTIQTDSGTQYFYTYPVFYISGDNIVNGNGTVSDPFIIK